MARDPLVAVRAVRNRFVEQARYVLSACLGAEALVAARIREIDDQMAQDRAALLTVENAHQFHEIVRRRALAWQADRDAAEGALAAAQARSAEARVGVATARAAAEAVETLMRERAVAEATLADRRAQHELDDIVRGRVRSGLRRADGERD